jgi:hypothetical protein
MEKPNLKPTSTFKLSKTTKRMMCFISDKALRNAFKRNMIQAQLAAEEARKTKHKED